MYTGSQSNLLCFQLPSYNREWIKVLRDCSLQRGPVFSYPFKHPIRLMYIRYLKSQIVTFKDFLYPFAQPTCAWQVPQIPDSSSNKPFYYANQPSPCRNCWKTLSMFSKILPARNLPFAMFDPDFILCKQDPNAHETIEEMEKTGSSSDYPHFQIIQVPSTGQCRSYLFTQMA